MGIQLADLLTTTSDVDCQGPEDERTLTLLRGFAVRLHSMGLSVREVVAVLEWLGVDRSRGAVRARPHRLADEQVEPTAVAVDEKRIEVDGDPKWLSAAIDTDSKGLLEIDVFNRRDIDPAAAFLHRPAEQHDGSETEFLVDGARYPTALVRRRFGRYLDYSDRNHVEK